MGAELPVGEGFCLAGLALLDELPEPLELLSELLVDAAGPFWGVFHDPIVGRADALGQASPREARAAPDSQSAARTHGFP